MKSRWNDDEANRAIDRWGSIAGPDLALRVYSSRLIGVDADLVLHGGGNTSFKGIHQSLLGDQVSTLWVKGSGSSLDVVEPRDFPALDLAYLLRLRALDSLTDEEMVNQLRTHLFDASSPNPSVEALLHAFLPQAFVDHSHADAVLAVTNQPDGAKRAREALGDRAVVLPYIMPGFPLAKAVAEAFEERPKAEAIVLEKHGLFTFGATARESYEQHIRFVDTLETYATKESPRSTFSIPRVAPEEVARRVAMAAPMVRGLLAEATGSVDDPYKRFIVDARYSENIAAFCASERAEALAGAGPLTPDHVIRTKSHAVFVGAPRFDDEAVLRSQLESALAAFRTDYQRYFDEHVKGRALKRLDTAPRVVLLNGAGVLAFGRSKKDAAIAGDITEHTLDTKLLAQGMSGYRALPESHLFAMEYWSLEQAKLGKTVSRPLESQVALITGGAGAIGRGIAEACARAGAHVVIVDRDLERAQEAASDLVSQFGKGSAIAVEADVVDEASMRRAFDRASVMYGGVDLVVPNAGIALVKPIVDLTAEEARRVSDVNYLGVLNTVREAARVMKAQNTAGNIVINASKNVFAPGKDFAAYSASKAAAHQLGKIAAIELAPLGIRVNQINADAVFGHVSGAGKISTTQARETASGLWSEVGPMRAASRGLSMEGLADFYRDRNLLRARVEARHVGEAVVFFASRAPVTTGATLPIDGGVPEAFPR